ncbi:TetR/AcrR family transcriptional regulator [Mycolicibacterium sp. CH28]|uniref:TetR/AcrR family transcriptional regulator n=1 Tax=Mycolicibacterium sp. CH28 TaxID=2512237 RepID=UPI0013868D19|nr:TetR/AcrR family transcriptional regulator [Mycolicibacterium sp. CH28]
MRPRLIADDVLLDAVLCAFANLGYEGTSIRAVAREIGISHNTINNRFGSKDKLWYSAVDHGFAQLADVLAIEASAESGDPLTQLHMAAQRFVDYSAANPALLRIVIHEASLPGPRFEHMYHSFIKPTQDAAARVITDLQARGRLRSGPLSPAFFFLVTMGLGSLAGLTDLLARFSDDRTDPSAIARLAVDIVFDGFTAT